MIHIITRNNQKTIQATLESILPLKQKILVGDYQSNDGTREICEGYGAEVVTVKGTGSEARNYLMELTPDEMCFYIEPWEILAKGSLKDITPSAYRVMVVQSGIISKEIRVWQNTGPRFVNPVYEELNTDSNVTLPITIYSSGRPNYNGILDEIKQWKSDKPVDSTPWYYQACTLLCLQKYDEFLKASEHYMHVGNKKSMSAIMNRYYYSMVQLLHFKKVRPTLQNLSICVAHKPLMAEFWCLMGDTHYHLTKQYGKAKQFYENAVFLGKKRPLDDEWPIDVNKYSKYPQKMIESCQRLERETFFISRLPNG